MIKKRKQRVKILYRKNGSRCYRPQVRRWLVWWNLYDLSQICPGPIEFDNSEDAFLMLKKSEGQRVTQVLYLVPRG